VGRVVVVVAASIIKHEMNGRVTGLLASAASLLVKASIIHDELR
jgi:hypothetical protein